MGLVDRLKGLFRRGGEEEKKVQETYVLKVKTPRGGWRKFREFDHFVTPDEIIDELPPGIYRLDVHREGQRGFEVAWGPIAAYDTEEDLEEMGIEEEPKRPKKREKGLGTLEALIDELEEQAKVLEKLGEIGLKLARFSGRPVLVLDGKTYEDVIIEGLKKMREKYEELDKIFGTSKLKGAEAELPIDGKIPAWAVYMPKMFSQMLDNIEARLYKWGLLGGNTNATQYNATQYNAAQYNTIVSDFPDIESYKRKYEAKGERTEEVKIEKKEKVVDEGSLQVDEVDIKEEDKSIEELLKELEEEKTDE